MKNKKVCCYLAVTCDLVCFVFGSYLFSLALISKTCTAAACSACCGCLSSLGLPLIALGFVINIGLVNVVHLLALNLIQTLTLNN